MKRGNLCIILYAHLREDKGQMLINKRNTLAGYKSSDCISPFVASTNICVQHGTNISTFLPLPTSFLPLSVYHLIFFTRNPLVVFVTVHFAHK